LPTSAFGHERKPLSSTRSRSSDNRTPGLWAFLSSANARPAPPGSRPGPLPVLCASLATGLDQCSHPEFYPSPKAQSKPGRMNPTPLPGLKGVPTG
jgi:hypothetical protein